jgi:hypothetical protein
MSNKDTKIPFTPYREERVDPVIIPCPDCGAKIITPNGAVVEWMRIPEAHCDCGFSGVIEWVNPRFSAQLEQLV